METKINLILNIANSNFLIINKNFYRKIGISNATILAFLINQFRYYYERNELTENLEFYVRDKFIEQEFGISNKTVRTILKKLKSLNLIDFEIRTMSRLRYVKLNFEKIYKILTEYTQGYNSENENEQETANVTESNRQYVPNAFGKNYRMETVNSTGCNINNIKLNNNKIKKEVKIFSKEKITQNFQNENLRKIVQDFLQIFKDFEFNFVTETNFQNLPNKYKTLINNEKKYEKFRKFAVGLTKFLVNFDRTGKQTEFPKTLTQLFDWIDTIRKLNEIDGFTYYEIRDAIEFARSDDFWKRNFLSIPSLRKKNSAGVMKIKNILAKFTQFKKSNPNDNLFDFYMKNIIKY